MTRSLLIAPQWIGDAVMTQPLLAQCQQRGERLTVAAMPWVAPIYEAMPECEAVLVLPFKRGALELYQRWSWARALRGQFERAYVCPNTFKSALLALWAEIPTRLGYVGEMRRWLLTHSLANPSKRERPSMVAFYAALVEADRFALEHPAGRSLERSPQLVVPPNWIQSALSSWRLTPQSYVVVAPGAEYGAAKRWPSAYFAQLCAGLDTTVVLLGSAKDQLVSQEIVSGVEALTQGLGAASSRPQILDLTGQTTLQQALALVAGARGLVSNDSGLMHVAAALGVAQVALFGSSSPLHTPPQSALAHVLWLKTQADYAGDVACSPCFQRTCPLGHFRCMNDLGVERVLPLVKAWDLPPPREARLSPAATSR